MPLFRAATVVQESPVKDLVRHQLAQSIATMSAVLADETIHDAVVEAGEITARAMTVRTEAAGVRQRRIGVGH